jgi:putative phosphoesterase
MKLGLISDTHNFLDPRVPKIFEGVDHILHAGDVGRPWLLVELEQIAPVTAVTGNTDEALPLRETELVNLGGKKFLVHHIVTPGEGSPRIAQKLRSEMPDVVLFGHTHKPFAQQFGPTLFFNPGYAGKQRFELPRSVALMELKGGSVCYRFVALD